MKTRELFKLEEAAPAPTIAPPKPGTKPSTVPQKPGLPKRHPNPFKDPTKRPRPGEEPDPKMCAEAIVAATLEDGEAGLVRDPRFKARVWSLPKPPPSEREIARELAQFQADPEADPDVEYFKNVAAKQEKERYQQRLQQAAQAKQQSKRSPATNPLHTGRTDPEAYRQTQLQRAQKRILGPKGNISLGAIGDSLEYGGAPAEAVVTAMLDEADIEQWTSHVPDDPGTRTYADLMKSNYFKLNPKGRWTPQMTTDFRHVLRHDPEVRQKLNLRWPAQEKTGAEIAQREREAEIADLSPVERQYYTMIKANFEKVQHRAPTPEELAELKRALQSPEVRTALGIR